MVLELNCGEIENRILQINGISSCVVKKISIDNKDVLCGYYVSKQDISEKSIKDFLRKYLPQYMIPSYIIRLDEMPYTINRKIDRKALPLPKQISKNDNSFTVDIEKLNSNEEKLIQIWKNILRLDNVSVNDNFFNIGGDSISAISLQIEALKYGINFDYADIFMHPTIKELAHKIPSEYDDFLEKYDYSIVNKVLERNTYQNFKTISKANIRKYPINWWNRVSWSSYHL